MFKGLSSANGAYINRLDRAALSEPADDKRIFPWTSLRGEDRKSIPPTAPWRGLDDQFTALTRARPGLEDQFP